MKNVNLEYMNRQLLRIQGLGLAFIIITFLKIFYNFIGLDYVIGFDFFFTGIFITLFAIGFRVYIKTRLNKESNQ
jgi:hypothetical protein